MKKQLWNLAYGLVIKKSDSLIFFGWFVYQLFHPCSGWGDISDGGPSSPILKYVYAPLIDNEDCKWKYGYGKSDFEYY